MSNLGAALKAGPIVAVKPLLLDQHLKDMDDSDRALMIDALNDPHWSDQSLAITLTNNGYSIATSSVRAWRVKNGLR